MTCMTRIACRPSTTSQKHKTSLKIYVCLSVVIIVWKGIHFKSDTNSIGSKGLPQAAVLPGSDADSDRVKPALTFKTVRLRAAIRLCALYDARCMGTLLKHGLRFVQRRYTYNLV